MNNKFGNPFSFKSRDFSRKVIRTKGPSSQIVQEGYGFDTNAAPHSGPDAQDIRDHSTGNPVDGIIADLQSGRLTPEIISQYRSLRTYTSRVATPDQKEQLAQMGVVLESAGNLSTVEDIIAALHSNEITANDIKNSPELAAILRSASPEEQQMMVKYGVRAPIDRSQGSRTFPRDAYNKYKSVRQAVDGGRFQLGESMGDLSTVEDIIAALHSNEITANDIKSSPELATILRNASPEEQQMMVKYGVRVPMDRSQGSRTFPRDVYDKYKSVRQAVDGGRFQLGESMGDLSTVEDIIAALHSNEITANDIKSSPELTAILRSASPEEQQMMVKYGVRAPIEGSRTFPRDAYNKYKSVRQAVDGGRFQLGESTRSNAIELLLKEAANGNDISKYTKYKSVVNHINENATREQLQQLSKYGILLEGAKYPSHPPIFNEYVERLKWM